MRLINESKAVSKIKDLKKDGAGAYAKGYNQALRTVISCLKNPDAVSTAYDASKVTGKIDAIADKYQNQFCKNRDTLFAYQSMFQEICGTVRGGGVDE